MYQNQSQPQQRPPMQRKRPWVHGLLSAMVPGLGSMMAGDGPVGTLLLLGIWFFWPIGYFGLAQSVPEGHGITFAVFLHFGAYLYGILRGVVAARAWNERHGAS